MCGGMTRLATGASGRLEAVDGSWRVVFRGPVSDEELNALPADQMIYVSGHEVRGQRASTIWVRAANAAAAQQAVEHAISAPGLASEGTPLPYWISVAVPDEDANALERALDARRARPGWIFASLVTKDPSDGFAELQYEVVAETDQGALRRGLEDYRDLRLDAGLPPHEPPYASFQPPWPGRQPQFRHQAGLERAPNLLDRGDWDLAVVVAQTAVELLIAQVISDRLQAIGDHLEENQLPALRTNLTRNVKTYSLNDDPSRELWDDLMHDTIKQADVWADYKDHVKRRHGVVHRGVEVNEDQATASLAAAREMIEHIRERQRAISR
jgi:HEPN domain-containing protein